MDELEVPGLQTHDSSPSLLNTVASIGTLLAAILAGVTQAKDHPVFAGLFLALGALAFSSVAYTPVVTRIRARKLRARRDRVARKSWAALLRFEKRFSEFLNNQDSRNLRYIISDICNRNDSVLCNYCPPDYLNEFFPNLLSRHAGAQRIGESVFRSAVTEFTGMVASYNSEYVLRALKRFRESPRLQQLTPENRKYREEAIEEFRDRWVKFLDDFKEFVDTANGDLGYEAYHEALAASFERPKRPAN